MSRVAGASLAGKKILLTGHTGFKGAWLSLRLIEAGATLTGLALPPERPSLFYALGLDDAFDSRIGDVRDAAFVHAVVTEVRPEIVFHLAAQPLVLASYADPAGTFATNVMGTVNVLEALRVAARPCAAVMVTTDKVYENLGTGRRFREDDRLGGHDPYSASKAAAEVAVASFRRAFFSRDAGIRVASARAGNVIGGGDFSADRIVPDLARALIAGAPVKVRNACAKRPWQHVLEPLDGYLSLAAAMLARPGDKSLADAFNFGPAAGAERSVAELVEAALAAWPGSSHGWIDASDPAAPHEASLLALSSERAEQRLGWRPRWDFARTVAETMGWYACSAGADPATLRDATLAGIARYEAAAPCP